MFEVERLAYLNALGITQYVARDSILGAKPSPLLDHEQVFPPSLQQPISGASDQPPGSDAPVQIKQPDTVDSGASVSNVDSAAAATNYQEPVVTTGLKVNIPKELLAESSVVNQNLSSTAAQHTVNSDDAAFEFCFVLLQSQQGVAFLMELDDPGVKDMSSGEHRLATDLLKALKIEREQVQANYFKWPLVNNPRLKQGPEEARESLLGYLDSKLANSTTATLLIFGDMPNRVLDKGDEPLALASRQLVTVQLPALYRMLQNWQHKAHAWRILAPLRGRKL